MTVYTPALRTEAREFFKLAVPLTSAQLAQSATGFADTIMMGRMGADVLAAGGLASLIYFSVMLSANGVVMAVSPLVAEAYGAGQRQLIARLTHQGMWLALLVAAPAMVVMAGLEPWLLYSGQTPDVTALAGTYLHTILWSLLPAAGFTVLRSTVAALSQARPIMVTIVVGTGCNILGNYLLGFGKLGLPALGLRGLALATVFTWWGMFLALALYVLRQPRLGRYGLLQRLERPHCKTLGRLAWVGLPIGAFSGLETGFFMVIMLWMGRLGTDALAAHQVVLQTVVVVFMIPLGISLATTVRVGQWLGRRNWAGLRRATGVSLAATTLAMAVCSALYLLFPRQIIALYLDVNDPANGDIVALAMPLLAIAAATQILDGLQKVIYGALQGLQDTRIPTLLNVAGFWGVGLSVSYSLGFILELGSRGLWIGQSVAIVVVTLLFGGRLCQRLIHRS